MTYWMTADLEQSSKAGATAYVSARTANYIRDYPAASGTITNTEVAVLHGISQGTIATMSAGKFSWRTFGSRFFSASVGHAVGQFQGPCVDIFLAGTLGSVTSIK